MVGGSGEAHVIVLVEACAEGGVIPVVILPCEEVLVYKIGVVHLQAACVERKRRILIGGTETCGAGVVHPGIAVALRHTHRVVEVTLRISELTIFVLDVIVAVEAVVALVVSVVHHVVVLTVAHVFIHIHVVAVGALVRDSEVCGQGHFRFPCLSFLGGDDDDAGGRARTVDGGGGGILEDVDLADVVGVDLGELTEEGHAVEHDHRADVGAERVLATELDRGALALCRSVVADLKAGGAAEKILH